MFIRLVTIALLLGFSLNAKASSLKVFFESLQKEILLSPKSTRDLELDKSVSVRPFNGLDRILSPDASATYNGKINQIKLDKSLLLKRGNTYEIKNAQEILKPNFMGSTALVTIFHEIGHAEMDVFIENRKSANDGVLMYQYHTKIKDLFKRNFKTTAWTAYHEYFAYYRTDLLEQLLSDKQDVYFQNGFNPEKGSCYLSSHAKKLLEQNISLEEFTQFYSFKPNRNYMRDINPTYIFVKGKDYNLGALSRDDQKIIQETNRLFWMYHSEEYGFPMTEKILVDRMNKNDGQLKAFKKCRQELFYKYR